MKYKILTDETKIINAHKVYRIQATKAFSDVAEGDKGGWVESEYNLSQEGNCWLYDEAIAYGASVVSENATIMDNAIISGYSRISGHAVIDGNAKIMDYTIVDGFACITNAQIGALVHITGYASIETNVCLADDLLIDKPISADIISYSSRCVRRMDEERGRSISEYKETIKAHPTEIRNYTANLQLRFADVATGIIGIEEVGGKPYTKLHVYKSKTKIAETEKKPGCFGTWKAEDEFGNTYEVTVLASAEQTIKNKGIFKPGRKR